MLRTIICYSDNKFEEIDDPATISDLLSDHSQHIWLDLEAPTEQEFRLIAEEFHLHPLAIEDAHAQHQRPKVEQYDGFYFVVFYCVDLIDPDTGERPPGRMGWESRSPNSSESSGVEDHRRAVQLEMGGAPAPATPAPSISKKPGSRLAQMALKRVDQLAEQTYDERIVLREIALFMGSNYVITVHADPIPELAEAERRWRTNAKLLDQGLPKRSSSPGGRNSRANGSVAPTDVALGQPPAADDIGILLYSLLDTIVDAYFPVVDSIVDRVEDIEEQIFEHFDDRSLQAIFSLKKDLLALRKVLAPERDVLNILTRRDLPIFHSTTIVYFQDIYDHVVRITEGIDTYRDLLSSALDSYLSMQSNRLNVTVQTLTTASIILMSMSLIAGIYGMNFDIMPELHWAFGYFYALGLMVLVAIILYFFFKHKRWL